MKNAITGNTAFGLSVDNSNAALINAEKNWWGDKDGPVACASCNGVNLGDLGIVDFTPWLDEPIKKNCGNYFPWPMFLPAITEAGK